MSLMLAVRSLSLPKVPPLLLLLNNRFLLVHASQSLSIPRLKKSYRAVVLEPMLRAADLLVHITIHFHALDSAQLRQSIDADK